MVENAMTRGMYSRVSLYGMVSTNASIGSALRSSSQRFTAPGPALYAPETSAALPSNRSPISRMYVVPKRMFSSAFSNVLRPR